MRVSALRVVARSLVALKSPDTIQVEFTLRASLDSTLSNLARDTGGHHRAGVVRSKHGPAFHGEVSWARLAPAGFAREVPILVVDLRPLDEARTTWTVRADAEQVTSGWTGRMWKAIPEQLGRFYGRGRTFQVSEWDQVIDELVHGLHGFGKVIAALPSTFPENDVRLAIKLAARNEYSPTTSQGRHFTSTAHLFAKAIGGKVSYAGPSKGQRGSGYAFSIAVAPGLNLDGWLMPTGWGSPPNQAKGSSLQVEYKVSTPAAHQLSLAMPVPTDWSTHGAWKGSSFSPFLYDRYLSEFRKDLLALAPAVSALSVPAPSPKAPDLPGPFDDDEPSSLRVARNALSVGSFFYVGPQHAILDSDIAATHVWESSDLGAEVRIEDAESAGFNVLFHKEDGWLGKNETVGWLFHNDSTQWIAKGIHGETEAIRLARAYMIDLGKDPDAWRQLKSFRRASAE